MLRAIGWGALVAISVTMFSGNSLYRPYFVLALPFLVIAGALLVMELQQRLHLAQGFLFGATALIVLNSVPILEELRQTDETAGRKAQFLKDIRTSPARVWISTDGTLPTLAGKTAFADYHSSDPVALDLVSKAKFQEWFLSGMNRADAVAVTDLLSMLVTPDTARQILDSGKPLVYESRSARERLEQVAGRNHSDVLTDHRD